MPGPSSFADSPTATMENYRQELQTVMQLKTIGGFHYIHQSRALVEKAKTARHWKSLLKTPPTQWQTVLKHTRQVLDQLES